MDAGDAAIEGGTRDAARDGALDGAIDAAIDAPMSDAGHGTAGQCETCTIDADCQVDMYCAPIPGGRACFAVCNFEMPMCPRGFQCVDNHTSTPGPACQPVGTNCCVDPDGDQYGTGVGCMGRDCDETSANAANVHPGAAEICDGIDQNCDGHVDEGDPATLCPPGTHVATTNCTAGACAIGSCEPNFADCNTTASDGCETNTETATDCGGCGMACSLAHSTAPACNHGVCAIGTCDAGYADCDGIASNGCETPINTATHCGSCGGTCSLPNSTSSCDTGTCLVSTCDAHWGDCNGRASDGCETPLVTTTDCGTCGTVCSPATGTGSCSTGTCRVTTCATGYEDCDMLSSNGCETSIRTLTDCGACGVPCTVANGVGTCSVGVCSLDHCLAGYGNCDGASGNGCEAPLTTLSNCGACGAICNLPNATSTCGGGTCAVLVCNSGWGDCDGIAANGCETSLHTLTDCGACRTACSRAGAVADCSMGMCQIGSCLATTADCDGMDANGCETSIRTLTDCGGCAMTCSLPNANPTCASGTCSISTCMSGFANCDGIGGNGCEASLFTLTNCGACGATCARANAIADCSTSAGCHTLACNAGWGNCDGVDANGCETPLTTLTNCGTCGTICDLANASETCGTGTCQIVACTSAYGDCDGSTSNGCETSIHTLTDCGGCGLSCSFPNAAATCTTGTCTLGACTPGYGNCDGNAANGCETPLNTLTNCGGCGTQCSFTNGSASCATGTCTLSGCSGNYGNCDMMSSNGCETSLRTLTDCGACGAACSFPNASASCSALGVCTLGTCNPGYANCDGNATNGCETPTTTLTDCGACGAACSLSHATASCASGTCTLSGCNMGYGNCDGSPSNGCETALNTLSNCGGCGTACSLANASSSCSTGTCAISMCNTGYANCDGLVPNGCETSTRTLTDCGNCGVACTVMSGTPSCATGTCQVSSCAAGYADCDGNSSNGCETSTHTLTNCGSCGTACSLPNATPTCSTGTCAISSCNAGYGDCDGNPANGCETPLNSLTNCAICGMSCMLPAASTSCATGMCTLTGCNPGYGNCDMNAGNGCETQLNSLTNCGMCGTACSLAHATASCSTGSCTIVSCAAGYGNCDGNTGNGCETQLNSLTNCGACGAGCSRANATATCSTGSCAIATCNALYGNCDSTDSNGCETPLTSVTNCMTCGGTCAPANATGTCTTGTCAIGSCNMSYYDVDAMVADGCECADDTSGSSCSGATNLGNVAQGATVSHSGNIPSGGLSDWYTVTFTGVGTGTPTIGFTASGNPGGVFRFDVFVGTCTTASTCTSPEAATGLTSWNFSNSFNGTTQPSPWPSTVFIRVSRTTGGLLCSNYQFQITRP